MNINFLFTFLGEPGGIPVIGETFLALAEQDHGRSGRNFSLATYHRASAEKASIPSLAMTRGSMLANILRYRKFLRAHHTDLVFYHYHTFPLFLCGTPYVMMIHDTNPFKETGARIATILNAIAARGIIVPSRATEHTLTEAFSSMHLGFLNKKIVFAPEPINPVLWPMLEHPPMERLSALSLERDSYFFTTGSDDLAFLARCVTQTSSRTLVVAGSVDASVRNDLSAQYGDRVRFVGFVDMPTLAALYAGARALVYRNANEGFGFIPLEAALAGTPVITNPDGSIRDTLGDVGRYYRTEEECRALIKEADVQINHSPRQDFVEYRSDAVFKKYLEIFELITADNLGK